MTGTTLNRTWKSYQFPIIFPKNVIGALAQKTINMEGGIGWDLDINNLSNNGFDIQFYDGNAPFTLLAFGH